MDIDTDGDNDLDIVAVSRNTNSEAWSVGWLENEGGLSPTFKFFDFESDSTNAEGVFVGDIDDDGDLDIVVASSEADTCSWYRNDYVESN